MNLAKLTDKIFLPGLKSLQGEKNLPVTFEFAANEIVDIYPRSVHEFRGNILFLGKIGREKFLYVLANNNDISLIESFHGHFLPDNSIEPKAKAKKCPLNHQNAHVIQEYLSFTRPGLIGVQNSVGLGDRLGLANPGHLRAIRGTPIRPVLAQQSIRELERTNRTAEEVMDAAIWAVVQEGYDEGFGADADHLKTTADIDRMVKAGFTMFTFDPGDHVDHEAGRLGSIELERRVKSLPWALFNDNAKNLIFRYANKSFAISDGFSLQPGREEVLRAAAKYGAVIAHTLKMYRHLTQNYPGYPFELELSVDETDSVTSSFEHYFIVSELRRRGIQLVSLAPRFVGKFEKGIDYQGDLAEFKCEYIQHLKIAEKLGPYKISIHSGSDKFSIYEVIGALKMGAVHIKTAGTSYLEALKVVSACEPMLFREILDFARARYENDKKSYHVSAKLANVPQGKDCADQELIQLFMQDDARQVLHVTFGSVLCAEKKSGEFLFKDRLLQTLKDNEVLYYQFLEQHFKRHIVPFL